MKNTGAIKFKDKINEDIAVINSVNKIFKNKRGYIVKMPSKGSSVVCCMSGGADAVSNIFILMNEFGYEVYPFFINRGQSSYKWEKASVDFYDKFSFNKESLRVRLLINIYLLELLGTYRGWRHSRGLPVRGQRT